jgi:hypothetical protein
MANEVSFPNGIAVSGAIVCNKNELQAPRAENLSSAPSSPGTGQYYFDQVLKRARLWNGSAWDNLSGSLSGYTVTKTDANNSSSRVSVLSITVPANTWDDGETIHFDFFTDTLQNSGGSLNLTPGASYNSNQVTGTAVSISANATEGFMRRHVAATRLNSSIYFQFSDPANTAGVLRDTAGNDLSTNQFTGSAGGVLTSQTFTADATLSFDVQWASANASAYYKVLSAVAYKISPITANPISSIITIAGIVESGSSATNRAVWRAPFPCTVTNVRGYRNGGTGATVNGRKNGSSNFLGSALSLTSADTWMDGGTIASPSIAAGDNIELMWVSFAGTPTYVTIQLDITRT